MKKLSIAEKIAKELGNDGTNWRTPYGTSYDDLIYRFRVSCEQSTEHVWRHIFADGSAIVERGDGGGWDIEGKTPFSWRGLE